MKELSSSIFSHLMLSVGVFQNHSTFEGYVMAIQFLPVILIYGLNLDCHGLAKKNCSEVLNNTVSGRFSSPFLLCKSNAASDARSHACNKHLMRGCVHVSLRNWHTITSRCSRCCAEKKSAKSFVIIRFFIKFAIGVNEK